MTILALTQNPSPSGSVRKGDWSGCPLGLEELRVLENVGGLGSLRI